MSRYAENTNVGEERSRAEVQFLLEKFGADQFGYASDKTSRCAKIMFRFKGANFVFTLPLAAPEDKRIKFTPGGKLRVNAQVEQLIRDENRRRWRSLCLTVKAMLIGVQDGIFNFAQVFMPYMVWGDGRTTYETLLPTAEAFLKEGRDLPDLGSQMRLLEARRGE